MHRFRRILVGLDLRSDDSALLQRAAELANANDATLQLVHVVDDLPFHDYGVVSDAERERLGQQFVAFRAGQLAERAAPIAEAEVSVSTAVARGKPGPALVRAALETDADLVLVGADQRTHLGEALLGGPATWVVRHAPCPVWVVKTGAVEPFARVLAALDLGPTDSPLATFDQEILSLAAAVAAREDSELHVLHVLPRRSGWTDWLTRERGDLLRRVRDAARWRLDRVLEEAALEITPQVVLVEGDPGRETADFAGNELIELIVMGTAGRTGVAGLLIGNTAEKVLARVDCSVLLVKPPGFVSPLAR